MAILSTPVERAVKAGKASPSRKAAETAEAQAVKLEAKLKKIEADRTEVGQRLAKLQMATGGGRPLTSEELSLKPTYDQLDVDRTRCRRDLETARQAAKGIWRKLLHTDPEIKAEHAELEQRARLAARALEDVLTDALQFHNKTRSEFGRMQVGCLRPLIARGLLLDALKPYVFELESRFEAYGKRDKVDSEGKLIL